MQGADQITQLSNGSWTNHQQLSCRYMLWITGMFLAVLPLLVANEGHVSATYSAAGAKPVPTFFRSSRPTTDEKHHFHQFCSHLLTQAVTYSRQVPRKTPRRGLVTNKLFSTMSTFSILKDESKMDVKRIGVGFLSKVSANHPLILKLYLPVTHNCTQLYKR